MNEFIPDVEVNLSYIVAFVFVVIAIIIWRIK